MPQLRSDDRGGAGVIPPHQQAYKIGNSQVSIQQNVPHGTKVKVMRELENNKLRVHVEPGQDLTEEDIDLFREEVYFL
jgi:hypothetical protein